jgi:general secretion pathway protein G
MSVSPSLDVAPMTRTARRRPAPRGFTLIEILVVLVVLAILATLVAPNVFRNVDVARETTARTQMEMLGAALDAYRLDNGRYPTTEQGLAALQAAPATEPRTANWRGPYLRKEVPMDPWGRPYTYRFPATNGKPGFELASYGADGQPGGEGENKDIP